MTDLEIVKECLITLNREAPFCAKMIEGAEAAERMAAEIERLKANLTRIADAMEKIARELEKRNKLKAATLRATIENDYLDEIMEG